jgi:uncharacterized LabA/DUF88 family protein
VSRRIKAQVFSDIEASSPRAGLYPFVYEKPSKSYKTSTVDVRLAVDMLSHAYQGNADKLLLFSGDRDFVPLVWEVVSRGVRVYVAAFHNGLSEELVSAADRFIGLGDIYFERATA